MIDLLQFRKCIVEPVLIELNMYSEASARLLLSTAIQELTAKVEALENA